MGGGLMAVIQQMLGGMGGQAGGMSGGMGMGGMSGGQGGEGFGKGMMDGMSFGSMGGGGGGGGGVKHAKNTKDIDHELGLSALQHYKDMSQPNFSGMNQGMQFANQMRPGGPSVAPVQQTQMSPYIQALLSGVYGGM